MRLIDADALEDKARQYSLGYYEEDEWAVPFKEITSAPTIDAVEVVRGEWLDYDRYMKCCSKCGWIQDILHFGSKYCPNCGCDMRGEDNE